MQKGPKSRQSVGVVQLSAYEQVFVFFLVLSTPITSIIGYQKGRTVVPVFGPGKWENLGRELLFSKLPTIQMNCIELSVNSLQFTVGYI